MHGMNNTSLLSPSCIMKVETASTVYLCNINPVLTGYHSPVAFTFPVAAVTATLSNTFIDEITTVKTSPLYTLQILNLLGICYF